MSERDPGGRKSDDVDEVDDGDQWRFGVEDVGPDGVIEADSEPEPVEPGDPRAENVLFFVLGVLVALGAFYAFLF